MTPSGHIEDPLNGTPLFRPGQPRPVADRDRAKVRAAGQRDARRRKRSESEGVVRARIDEARRTGKPYVAVWPDRLQAPIEGEATDGTVVRSWPGWVEFVNPPNREFDYRITVVVRGGLVVDGDVVRSDGSGRYLDAGEVAVIPRPGGERFGVRALHSDGVGELVKLAVRALTETEGARINKDSTTRLLRRPPPPRSDLLEIVAEAVREAEKRGLGRHQHVAAKLARAGRGNSLGQVKKLLKECTDAGMIPKARPGRPRGR